MSITLAAVEQEAARRLGPFYVLPMDRQAPSTANLERAFFPGLRSTVEQDLVTNLWLLRRGVLEDGTHVDVLDQDRQRTVAVYDASSGAVIVDRPWSQAPAAGEVCELGHLDPSQELRVAVRGGLRRCWFEDRFSLGTAYIYEADLTAARPWLDNPRQVLAVVSGTDDTNGVRGQQKNIPFTVFGEGGHVWVRLNGGGGWGGGVLVSVLRPHFTWVNGADAPDGPVADDDKLDVDLDYAAAAAHIEAWHRFPAKLQAAAAGGLQATQQMAAQELTRQSRIHVPSRTTTVSFDRRFSLPRMVAGSGRRV